MPRRSKVAIEAATKAVEEFKTANRRRPEVVRREGYGGMDIRLRADGTPVLFTWYRGHAFEGWINEATLRRAEEDGVLSWDSEGNPVIDESKVKPVSPSHGPAWVGVAI